MRDILQGIHQYSTQLAISNVVKFFDQRGVTVTKSMIQNYVRDGLLPPPVNKRYYTHKHLAALALIDALKTVYEMTVIRAVLKPLMDEEGIPLEVYHECVQKTEEMAARWQESVAPLVSAPSVSEGTLFLMAHSVDLKDEVIEMVNT